MNLSLNNVLIIFLSIFLEALPFVLLGSILSSFFEVFLSPGSLKKVSNGNIRSYFFVAIAAFFFPICECAIIPVMRRLIKKGMSPSLSITFMLAAPTVNFVVFASTVHAFPNANFYPVMRVVMGYFVAVFSGLIFSKWIEDEECLREEKKTAILPHTCTCCQEEEQNSNKKILTKLLSHTSEELYDVGKYLIFGAALSALLQVYVPNQLLTTIGLHPVFGIVALMGLAFLLSLCSEADAFIAATLQGRFLPSAVLSFMVFGPMVDIKNILLLTTVLKKKYLIQLVSVIAGLCFILHFTLGFFIVYR